MHREHGDFFDMEFSLGLIPLTFGPFLYLYTEYLIEGRKRFRSRDYLHFLPFALLTSSYFIFFKDVVEFNDTSYLKQDPYLWVRMVYALVFFGSILIYTLLTFQKLRQYRQQINTRFSYRDGTINLFWLNFIAILFSVTFIVYFIVGSINAVAFDRVIDTATISHVGLTILAFSISYFGLKQPLLFRNIEASPPEAPLVDEADDPEAKAETKPKLETQEANRIQQKLERIMQEEKPYLNAELTLHDLSALLNVSKPELTYLLNAHIGKNFFTYVNEYRLKAVIRRLENPDYDHLTIMAIAYDCGFNSKSTFNSLFKQFTGQTPSEFKKQRQ
jgi:AraC-like DNA-binding protein